MKSNVKQKTKHNLIPMNRIIGGAILAMLLFGCSVMNNGSLTSKTTTDIYSDDNSFIKIDEVSCGYMYSVSDEPIVVLERWMVDLEWSQGYSIDTYMVEEWMLSSDGWNNAERDVLASEIKTVENWMIQADFIQFKGFDHHYNELDQELNPWMLSSEKFFIKNSFCNSIFFESIVAMDIQLN